ncbi:TatD family hydrolase [Fusobacterium sp. IOR10]|uniref:TatD family hydrolase n=1 Tax=Fusobacterium sp. IOR10 TaxID=2665157 RepID=UPI0013D836B1|nr:TatD family hydrolase [Fusobacterium sp. IOR10]
MKIVDTHCHIDDRQFDEDRDDILKDISESMDFIVNIGCDLDSSEKSVNYAKNKKFMYAVVGIHPTEIKNYNEETEKKIEELLKEDKVVAVGEIGLDYHWMVTDKDHQKEIFLRQMELAKRFKKPVVIHSRDAMEDTLNILEKYPDVRGIFHCFPGSIESASKISDRYYFGIGGVLTFKNSRKTVEFLKKVDINRVVLETDSPYLSPVPFRGKRNTPLNVKYVAEKIAEIKGISFEKVVEITTKNAKEIYNIK